MKKNNFYVTTPIYYVNDKPHIGHAYTTLLADVLARYHRLMGLPTWFLTGTDEHGQKVKQAAEKSGISTQEQVDKTVVRFQELWKKLEITNDDFIRTTEPRHKKVVQNFLQDLYDRDEIYRADYDGWYCVACERFYTEKDLVDGNCPEASCGRKVEQITETNYFFRMSKYQDWLIGHIQENPKFIQPDFRRNETLGFLKKNLNDLCISRPKSRMDWGIELPFDKDFVTYVWFDALLNYISAIGCRANEEEFKKWWPATYHLIGKDILTTHTVYWPTMLKAMNLPMPETIFAHGWWLIGRDKMSKTVGNVVNPMQFADQYGVDPFRYFLMAEMTLGQDASFTEEAFVRRYNAELANDLGNMLNRVIKIVGSSCQGNVPDPGKAGEDELVLQKHVKKAASDMIQSVEGMRIDLGLASIAKTVREVNKYLEKTRPWQLAKNNESERLGTVLYHALESLRVISGMLYPVMPGKMAKLRQCIGLSTSEPVFKDLSVWGKTKPGTKVGEMINLFPRIQKKKPEPQAQNSKSKQTSKDSNLIDITDFGKVKFKVAKIVEVEKVPEADKLLKLQIEIGQEKRQIVSGIAEFYTPDSLIGKHIVVVTNLKPATIRGVESNGMLLAAQKGKELCLITPDGEIASGAKVG